MSFIKPVTTVSAVLLMAAQSNGGLLRGVHQGVCGNQNYLINMTDADYCANVGKHDLMQFEQCCVDPMQAWNSSVEPVCQNSGVNNAVCAVGECGENQTFVLDLNLEIEDAMDATCCADCSCYADPHCKSFDGSMNEWAICDARKLNDDGSCPPYSELYQESVCDSLTDGFGHQCEWVGLSDFYKTNGPCQPANTDEYSFMKMFESATGGFELSLALGSRGNIAEGQFVVSGSNSTLIASECFTAWENKDPSAAWTNGIPFDNYSWVEQVISDDQYEIMWELVSKEQEVVVRVNCATQWHNGKMSPDAVAYRLDVNELLVYNESLAMQGSGYCVDNEIRYDTSIVVNNPDTNAINAACAFGTNVEQCQIIISTNCTEETYESSIESWCDGVYKPVGGIAQGNADVCLDLLQSDSASQNINIIFAQAIQFKIQKHWTEIVAGLSDGSLDGAMLAQEYNHGLAGASVVWKTGRITKSTKTSYR